jgi:uncharacterized FlaG/YvyC family protein
MEIGRTESYASQLATSLQTALSPQERAEQRQLIHAVEALNKGEFFGPSNELQMNYDRGLRRNVIKIVDVKTKEVVQQIPPEYVLRLAKEAAEE